jgi:hypothetical protein
MKRRVLWPAAWHFKPGRAGFFVSARGKPIDTKTGMLILLIVGALLTAGVSNVQSGEEVVGQYFFRFGIDEVNGDFSKPERRYTISGTYAVGHDFNYELPFDPAKRKLDVSFSWVAEGRYNAVTNATSEKLDLFNTTTRAPAGSLTSTMVCNRDPWLEASTGPCQFVVTTASFRYQSSRPKRSVFVGADHNRTLAVEPSVRHLPRGAPKTRTRTAADA